MTETIKKNKLQVIILTAILTAMFSSSALAGQHKKRGMRHEGPKAKINYIITHVDSLTADQIVKLKELQKQHKEQSKAQREKLRQLREKMRAAWDTENPSQQNIMNLFGRIHKLQGEMHKSMIRLKFKVMKVLTKEQQKEVREMRKERREKKHRGKKGNCDQGKRKGPGHGKK